MVKYEPKNTALSSPIKPFIHIIIQTINIHTIPNYKDPNNTKYIILSNSFMTIRFRIIFPLLTSF
jgi:hypothetical protein